MNPAIDRHDLHRFGDRLHERPAAAGPPVPLPGHPAQPLQQCQLGRDSDQYVAEAFKHKKPIGALGDGVELLRRLELPEIDLSADERGLVSHQGVVTDGTGEDVDTFLDSFADAIAEHRHWDRSDETVPA